MKRRIFTRLTLFRRTSGCYNNKKMKNPTVMKMMMLYLLRVRLLLGRHRDII